MLLKTEDFKRISEAAAKAGVSLQEAIKAFSEAFWHLFKAATEIASVADIIEKHKQPPDETLRAVASGREWYLMNNAKKYRTRKKYRNRLIKRYNNETQTERSTKA